MKVDLFSFAGMYSKVAATGLHLLERGAAHAAANGVSEAEYLERRLYPDMFPLREQFHIVANFPRSWMARATGQEVPAGIEGETTVAQIKAAIADTKAWLDALTPEQFAGRDDIPLTVSLGQIEPTQPTGQWITGFATTNVMFHLSIAYAILRHHGVPLGKVDLFAGGL